MSEELFLGLDGGKSKTVCLLARSDGTVVGKGRSGSSDKGYMPFDHSLDVITDCVKEAVAEAGVILPVTAGCFGLAGADWPEEFEELKSDIAARGLAKQVLVKNDMHIALRAATRQGVGVVVSAGTHTAAAIRTPEGREWHSGWFSVEGPGGVTAGHKVLWAVLQAEDGRGRPTALTEMVLSATGKSSPMDLLRAVSAGEVDDDFLAPLAPLVFQAHFRHGDAVAAEIVIGLGKEVARWATGLLARFDLLNQEIPVFLAGGLFKGEGSLLMDAVTMAVHARAPKAVVRRADREPVLGALLYAYELGERPVTLELINTLDHTGPGPEFYKTG